MAWQRGDTIQDGKYTIREVLGTGGFGITYRIRDQQGQLFVLKTLNAQVQARGDFLKCQQDFMNEALRLMRCEHPHIVKVYKLLNEPVGPGAGKQAGPGFFGRFFGGQPAPSQPQQVLCCILMEYIQGQTLARYVSQQGALPEAEALRYIRQIGEALGVVHQKDMLHRDVKPGNIMLRDRTAEAVLIDFGLARELVPGHSTHTLGGTPTFGALEQLTSMVKPGAYTDVYALAATLYYLVTATLPMDAVSRAMNAPLKPPLQLRPDLSEQVHDAIAQGMALQPADRPQTVQEWLSLLPGDTLAVPALELPKVVLPAVPVQAVSAPVIPVEVGRVQPDLQQCQFEVVTVNARGKVIERQNRWNEYREEDLGHGVKLRLMKIPEGRFLMGAPEGEAKSEDWERPQHWVQFQAFWMGQTTVTQAQWRQVATRMPKVERDLNPEPSIFKNGDLYPVEWVSWEDGVEFCQRLTRQTGREYRLPTEAEWEYACRAGTTTPFHFGDTITTNLANYRGTDEEELRLSGSYGDGPKGIYRERTTEVGSFKIANAFGLCDMHGNVWEWCEDVRHDNYKGAPTDGSAWLTGGNASCRVIRGGSWVDNPRYCRSAYHYYNLPDYRDYSLGFRVVCLAPRTL